MAWQRVFTVGELDRFISRAKDLRRGTFWARSLADLGKLVVCLEQSAVAWAIATRLDLELTRTGKALREGSPEVIAWLRAKTRAEGRDGPMNSVMAQIALEVNDSSLTRAAGTGDSHGSHRGSLRFAELWCRNVEDALGPAMDLLAANQWVFADTESGQLARELSMNAIGNFAYRRWIRRVVRLQREDLLLSPNAIKKLAFYARLDPVQKVELDGGAIRKMARALSRTSREMIRDAENKRFLVLLMESTPPRDVFRTDPRVT